MLHYYRGDEESGYTLKRNIDEQRRETANLKYYLRVHGVQDEGYHDITRYYRRQDRQLQRLLSLQRDTKRQTAIITQRISILRKALANLSGAKFTTQARYEAIVQEGKQRQRYPLHAVAERSRQGYLLLQRTDSITPDSARAVSMVAWPRMLDEEALVTTYRDLYARHVIRDNRLNISRRLGITPIGPLPAGYTGYWLSRQDNGSVAARARASSSAPTVWSYGDASMPTPSATASAATAPTGTEATWTAVGAPTGTALSAMTAVAHTAAAGKPDTEKVSAIRRGSTRHCKQVNGNPETIAASASPIPLTASMA